MKLKTFIAGLALLSAPAFADHPVVESTDNLGDLVLLPYYTVQEGFVTGFHITNVSSTHTQVVKFRLRRAEDSIDVLDINVILSPNDVWTGYLRPIDDILTLVATDDSCTAPYHPDHLFRAPLLNILDADEGYVEIIGMGSADAAQPISINALHTEDGVPFDCVAVERNFYEAAVTDSDTTTTVDGVSEYTDVGNVLRASFLIRDTLGGLEFGDAGTHITNFAPAPMMSHQQSGVRDGSITGFDFPDLSGGAGNGAPRGLFEGLRERLGGAAIINDWSYSAVNQVNTDWVVTFPGQYLMRPSPAALLDLDVIPNNRDIPIRVELSVWDREEQSNVDQGMLQVSPQGPTDTSVIFDREVNVVEWGPLDDPSSVFGSAVKFRIDPGLERTSGWAKMEFESTNQTRRIFDLLDLDGINNVETDSEPPVIGLTFWRRSFNNPDLDYGRAVPHSRLGEIIPYVPCEECIPCDPCEPPPPPPVEEEDRLSDLAVGGS